MKVGIVGAGFVGAAAANALVLRGIPTELVLVDMDQSRAAAEAADVAHVAPFGGAGPMSPAGSRGRRSRGARVVVVTAGSAQTPGQSRMDLLARNAAIVGSVVPDVFRHAPRHDPAGGDEPGRRDDLGGGAVRERSGGAAGPGVRDRNDAGYGPVPPDRGGGDRGRSDPRARVRRRGARGLGGAGVEQPRHRRASLRPSSRARWAVSFTGEDRRRVEGEVVHAADAIISGKGARRTTALPP